MRLGSPVMGAEGGALQRACARCPSRSRCGEGIHALRLTHTGVLRPCMDRPDLGVDLLAALRDGGPPAASSAWSCFLAEART